VVSHDQLWRRYLIKHTYTERVQKPQGDHKRIVQETYVDGNASDRGSTEVAEHVNFLFIVALNRHALIYEG
jgi:hypothetical protein